MKTAVRLLKLLAEGEDNIHSGKTYDQDEVFDRLARKLKKTKSTRAKKTKL
jgi:hypothetical protein